MAKRSVVLVLAVSMALLAAIPAVAESPVLEVWTFEEELDFEGPNCIGSGSLVLETTVTVRDVIFDEGEGGKVISTMSIDITGPDPWSGRGTRTQLQHNDVRTLSVQFVATNSDTGQRIQFHANTRYAEDAEPNLEPPFGLRCIKA